jgi:hypothetical protein
MLHAIGVGKGKIRGGRKSGWNLHREKRMTQVQGMAVMWGGREQENSKSEIRRIWRTRRVGFSGFSEGVSLSYFEFLISNFEFFPEGSSLSVGSSGG